MLRKASSSLARSTPSMTTLIPVSAPRSIILATIASRIGSRSQSRTTERSRFTMSGFRSASLANPE